MMAICTSRWSWFHFAIFTHGLLCCPKLKVYLLIWRGLLIYFSTKNNTIFLPFLPEQTHLTSWIIGTTLTFLPHLPSIHKKDSWNHGRSALSRAVKGWSCPSLSLSLSCFSWKSGKRALDSFSYIYFWPDQRSCRQAVLMSWFLFFLANFSPPDSVHSK